MLAPPAWRARLVGILSVAAAAALLGQPAAAQTTPAPDAAAVPPAPSVPSPRAAAGSPIDDVPTTEPMAPARRTSPEPKVEQLRDVNRHVSAVDVVPAGSTIHYTLQNREGQRPLSPLSTAPGLSTQRFFRVDF
ncbi:MAG TPA: hypothetical protein VMU33_03510 [Burkholderiaceae bacterium]|nr:hypothetical protein [Burkholderiaceae bacterium]